MLYSSFPSTTFSPDSFWRLRFRSSIYLVKVAAIDCAWKAVFDQILAWAAVFESASASLNCLYVRSFFWAITLLEFSRLRFTVVKAFNTSVDTFSASSAVSTKYIILIIFCLGSLGKDMG